MQVKQLTTTKVTVPMLDELRLFGGDINTVTMVPFIARFTATSHNTQLYCIYSLSYAV